jgi:hypothetical protein
MKPPRPLLNIELFEDRLLPSTAIFESSNTSPILTPITTEVSAWHNWKAIFTEANDGGTAASLHPTYQHLNNITPAKATANEDSVPISNDSANLAVASANLDTVSDSNNNTSSAPTASNDNTVADSNNNTTSAPSTGNDNTVSSQDDNASTIQASGNENAIPASYNNANSANGVLNQTGTNEPEHLFGSTNTYSDNEWSGEMTGNWNSGLPQKSDYNTVTAPISLNDSLNENSAPVSIFTPQPISVVVVFNFNFSDFRSAAMDGHLPPWFSHNNQPSYSVQFDELNNPGPSAARNDIVAPSDPASDAAVDIDATSSQSPAEPVAPVSTPTQGVFLVSLSTQLNAGLSLNFEQAPSAEQHSQSEITLAAISLISNQSAYSLPASPLLPPTYSTSAFDTNLPTISPNRSSSSVKAPAQVRFASESSDLQSTLSPIEIAPPSGEPVAGVIGLNAADLDERVANVLSSISSLGAEITVELGQPEAYTWLVAAGLLSVGAGYSAWVNRKSQRVALTSLVKKSLSSWEGGI